jgi:hypothetical protein
MNAPVPPTVDLGNLGKLASMKKNEKKRTRGRVAVPVAATLIGTMGVAVWRVAMMAAARRKSRARRSFWLGGGVGLAALGVAGWQLQRFFNGQPEYQVEQQRGVLEIRRYPAVKIAETTVDDHWDAALEQGFRRLAGFIFGGNDAKQRISMTSPVLGSGNGDGFHVAFVLPKDVIAPPVPDDARVKLGELPARRLAVLRFHGRYDAPTIAAKKVELTHALVANGLAPIGEASFAGYDPPTTLPLLRRNELWVEIEEQIV